MANWITYHSEGNCDLFPFYFFTDPWTKMLKPILGQNVDMLLIIRNSFLTGCVDRKQYEEVGKRLFEKIMKEDFFSEIMNNTDLRLRKVEDYIIAIEGKDFSACSNSALAAEFNKYCDLIFDLNMWGMMITLMEYAKSSYVSDVLKQYLEKHFRKHGINEATAGVIGVLSTPSEETYLRKQKREITELAIRLGKNSELQNLFREKTEAEIIESLKKNFPEEFQSIKRVKDRYCWIAYGYEGPALSFDYFVLELKNLLAEGNAEEKIREVNNEGAEITDKQERLMNELKIGDEGKRLFGIARGFMFKKEFRKQTLFHAFYAVENLQREIAKRLGLSLKQVRYFTPSEITTFLGSETAGIEHIANARLELVAYKTVNGQISILAGLDAELEEKQIERESVDTTVKEIAGQSAYAVPEKITGKARVAMTVEEASGIQDGEILVSYSTNPNMVRFMKKAAAVVTEQGGITCHAAIVSRELRIPCVVGTKIATKIIKNGDLIEVDTQRGTVRKI